MRALIILLALAVALTAQTTWVVDKAGGGDFVNLVEANAGASDGDIVEVRAGTYFGSPTITKNLRIVGPSVGGAYTWGTLGISSPIGASVRGMGGVRLHIFGCDGPVLVQDSAYGTLSDTDPPCFAGRISGSSDVRIERVQFIGREGTPECSGSALIIENSQVQLVDCSAVGGWGIVDDGIPQDGSPAYELRDDSTVVFSGCDGRGGAGGLFIGQPEGEHAPCVWVEEGSTAILRGNASTVLEGGRSAIVGGQGPPAPAVAGDGTVVHSGAVLDPPGIPASLILAQPVPAQPFAHLGGDLILGGTLDIDTFGPAGATQLLFITLDPATLTLPGKVEGLIGIDLGTTVLSRARTLNGQALADSLSLPIPNLPELESVRLVAQSFVAGLYSGTPYFALNPTALLVASAP